MIKGNYLELARKHKADDFSKMAVKCFDYACVVNASGNELLMNAYSKASDYIHGRQDNFVFENIDEKLRFVVFVTDCLKRGVKGWNGIEIYGGDLPADISNADIDNNKPVTVEMPPCNTEKMEADIAKDIPIRTLSEAVDKVMSGLTKDTIAIVAMPDETKETEVKEAEPEVTDIAENALFDDKEEVVNDPPVKKTRKKRDAFEEPTEDEVLAYANERGLPDYVKEFVSYYNDADWKKSNGRRLVSWQNAYSQWCARQEKWFPQDFAKKTFAPPSVDDVKNYAKDNDLPDTWAQEYIDFYAARGWVIGNTPITDWAAGYRHYLKRYESILNAPSYEEIDFFAGSIGIDNNKDLDKYSLATRFKNKYDATGWKVWGSDVVDWKSAFLQFVNTELAIVREKKERERNHR